MFIVIFVFQYYAKNTLHSFLPNNLVSLLQSQELGIITIPTIYVWRD